MVHFFLGALLNLYAIFYFKSSSLLVSFAFLGVLVAVLLANEVRRIKAFGLAADVWRRKLPCIGGGVILC